MFLVFNLKNKTLFVVCDYQTWQFEYVFSMHEFFGVQILNLRWGGGGCDLENSISHKVPAGD